VNQAVADLLECPNYGTPLVRRYCPECGQKVGPVNPTLHDFLHDLTHELLHVDSKIFSVAYFAASTLAPTPVFRPDEEIDVGTLGGIFGVQNVTPEEANSAIAEAQTHWAPRLMFLLVPVSALLVQMVTRRTGRNYPQHLYFTLHVHAAYFGLLAVTAMIDLLNVKTLSNVLSLVGPILLIAYTLVAFHTAYGGRWRLAAGRTVFVLSFPSVSTRFHVRGS
jgi:hypothetical protein